MVKKGSIFARIAERWRSGTGLKVDADRRAGERAIEPARATANRQELAGSAFAGEPMSTRKLSDREEAMVTLGGHFQELATLLRGVHSRMDSQLGRLVETATTLQQMPALADQQIELMRSMSGQMEVQNQLGEQVARSLCGLPDLLRSVESALQRAAQSDERTAATMCEFQATMDRIHGAMGKMVEHGEQHVSATQRLADQREESMRSMATGFEQAQKDAVRELRSAADESLQSLRRTHEDQSNRLQRVVQEHAGWNKAVLAVLGVVAIGIVTLLAVLLAK